MSMSKIDMSKNKIYIFIILLFLAASCANMGTGPQGGPKDETPPKILAEAPLNGSINYTGKTIRLEFDEYIVLDNVVENVLVSPPQQRPPEVKAIGKRVTITFAEALRDSTTYTIDFGRAICDNNEKNPLEGYSFSFSTGDVIDSLQIAGRMLNAEDLNPISGIYVGVHEILDDSALTTIPFTRIGKTDSEGYFTIRNLRHGTYRLYALNDVSRDFLYQPGEGLAFLDSTVTPSCETVIKRDTIYKTSPGPSQGGELGLPPLLADTEGTAELDTPPLEGSGEVFTDPSKGGETLSSISLLADTVETSEFNSPPLEGAGEVLLDTLIREIDTIIVKHSTTYAPDDLILFYFNENKQRHYFVRALRENQHYFQLLFAAPQDSLPVVTPIGEDWLQYTICQHNETNDTITYWLIDSIAIKMDTLEFEMQYMKSDSVYVLQPQLDTVRAIYRAPRISDKARERMEKNKQTPKVEISHNIKAPFEIYNPIVLRSATPLTHIEIDSLHLYQMVDTVRKPLPIHLEAVDSAHTAYRIMHDWEAGASYQFEADSAAFTDIYGYTNNAFKGTMKVRSLDEYSTLIIKTDPDTVGVVVQLLDDKEKVIRSIAKTGSEVRFENVAPKDYYVRMFIDWNGDGEWTTGDWLKKQQPEPVYYFPHKLTLRANWDFEETIHFLDTPQIDQKPDAIFKTIDTKKQK